MPQLDTATFLPQLFWLVVCFLTLYGILSRVVLPKITRALETRKTTLEDTIHKASLYRDEAEILLTQYEQDLAHARAEAQKRTASALHGLSLDLAQKKHAYTETIATRLRMEEEKLHRARTEINADIHTMAESVAQALLERLTKRAYTREEVQQ